MKLQINIPATDKEVASLFLHKDRETTLEEDRKIIQFLNAINKKGCVFCNGRCFFVTRSASEPNPIVFHFDCEDCGFRHEFNLKTLLDKSKNLLTPEDKKKRS